MKITVSLIDGNNMEFEGKYGEVGTGVKNGFYIIKLAAEDRIVEINTQFILCIDIENSNFDIWCPSNRGALNKGSFFFAHKLH